MSEQGFIPLEGGARELGTLLFALQLVSHGKALYFRGLCDGPASQPHRPFLPWGCPGVVPPAPARAQEQNSASSAERIAPNDNGPSSRLTLPAAERHLALTCRRALEDLVRWASAFSPG